MNARNLMPQQSQPISRVTVGQMPHDFVELAEAGLQEVGYQGVSEVMPSTKYCPNCSVPFHEGGAE